LRERFDDSLGKAEGDEETVKEEIWQKTKQGFPILQAELIHRMQSKMV